MSNEINKLKIYLLIKNWLLKVKKLVNLQIFFRLEICHTLLILVKPIKI
jgi:hypothetical protein